MESKEKRVYKIVLTGGPCGGKTTGQARLSTFFENLGWKVFRVPETATVLLSGGIKFSDLNADQAYMILGDDTHTCARCVGVRTKELTSCSEAYRFQENLLKTMLQIENTFFELAESSNRDCLIICDRGAMDASAFIAKEQWDKLMASNGWNNVELRDNRYNQIVHMVTAANGAEDFYTIEDHACRSEGMELARELDYNAASAWVGHPYFDVIDNSTEFEKKIRRMIASICQKMGIDTGDRLLTNARKRKFLVKVPLPSDEVFPPFQDFEVVHNYLTSNHPYMQARLRKRGQKGHWSYTHTIRKPRIHGQIVEVKTQLTHRDYVNLLNQKDNSHFTIYKKRRCFLYNNQYFQLDIYKAPCHPRCNGLVLLETYSALEDGHLEEALPKFLKISCEVTGDPQYSMYNLSLRAEWSSAESKFCHSLKVPDSETMNGGIPNMNGGIPNMNGISLKSENQVK